MKKIILLALTGMLTFGVRAATSPNEVPHKNAVPAYRGLIERVQPNGDTLRTYLRGDERKHWSMTEDGWQIKESDKGWLKYAKKNRKGQVVISLRKAHNVEKRSKCEKRWLERHGVKGIEN